MPMSKYNSYFGGKPGAASKAMEAMQKEYGPDKGEHIFYALKNKRKKMGRSAIAEPGKPVVGGVRMSSV